MEMNDLMKLAQVQNAFVFLLCGSNQTLLGIFVITFCGSQLVFMFNILSNLWWFFPLPHHHALDIIDIQYLTFDCNGQQIWVKHLNQLIRVVSFVSL
jgi:hypothetical protein